MKKVVLKLDLHDDKDKQKAMKSVSCLSGIDSISMDMKEKKLTVIGAVDPVSIVNKLRKYWHVELFSVGPAKEPEKKKEEPKKEPEKRKEEPKEAKKETEKKRDPNPSSNPNPNPNHNQNQNQNHHHHQQQQHHHQNQNQNQNPYTYHYPIPNPNDQVTDLVRAYQAYNPHMTTHYYVQSAEENPNSCVIC